MSTSAAPSAASAPARWSLTVSPEVDASLREYLGAQGMKKGDLSRFVEEAVRWRLFDQAVQSVKARHADADQDALQALIDEALDAVRQA